jgi:UDP-N-acetylmuramate dehydrogenase
VPDRTRDASRPQTGVRLAGFTTLRLGGPAGSLTVADSEEAAVAAVRAAGAAPLLVLAGGSNVVVGDAGFPGQVVLLRNRGYRVARDGGRAHVSVAAGEPWDTVVAATIADGLAGLECLSGIPGSAGATPIQNVGAYGQEVAETIVAVRVYDRRRDEVLTLPPAACGFAYRTSVFKYDDRFVVLSVDFSLAVSPRSAPIRYAELARTLGVRLGERVPLGRARAAVLALRAGKGMVLDPADPDTYSVGSFFTNPVLDGPAFAALRARADGLGEPPAWPGADGAVKTSAAWLIERAGFTRGYGRDGVAISGKHTLALTNRGAGTTDALLGLAREIRDGVAGRFGVALHPEPVLVGCAL